MASDQPVQGRRLLLAYAEASRDLVAPLARALEAAGFAVDWAPASPASAPGLIDTAKTVVVCWTPAAVASDAVNLQAARARKANKLTPVILAPCTPPANLGGRFHIADLSGWRGDSTDPEFLAFVHSLHGRLSGGLSGRMLDGGAWKSRLLSWGGASAAGLAAIALIVNFGGLKQAYDSLFNPSASEKALVATDAKVDEVLTLLKSKSGALGPGAENALRESIARLLSAQDGARGAAAEKLFNGDVDGALRDLNEAAQEGEKAAAGLAETWKEIGALAYPQRTWDAIDAYERAVELVPTDPAARSQLGNLYMRAGRLDDAELAFMRVFDDAGEEDLDVQALAAGSLGQVAMRRGAMEAAEDFLNQALEIDQQIGSLEGQAADLADLGHLRQQRGEMKAAETMFRQAIDLQVKAGNPQGHSDALGRLGYLLLEREKTDEAEASFREALAISERQDDVEGRAFALAGLGNVAGNRKQASEAAALYLEALALAEQISSTEIQATTLTELGLLAENRGDKTEAIERFRSAMEIYRQMGLQDDVRNMQDRLKKNGATPAPEGAER